MAFVSYDKDNPRVKFAIPFLSECKGLSDKDNFCEDIETKLAELRIWVDELPESATVVFSCEWLIDMRDTEIARFKELVCNNIDTSIIIYLREPVSYTISAWSQHTCNGFNERLVSPSHFVSQNNSKIFEFKLYIENWAKAFPSGVIIRRFDEEFMINKDLLHDFCYVCDIPWVNNYYRPKNRNTSLGWQAQKILSAININIPWILDDGSVNKNRGNIVDYMHCFGDKNIKYIPSVDELAFLNSYFHEYNEWLRATYFPTDLRLWSTKVKSRSPDLDGLYSLELSQYEVCVVDLITKIMLDNKINRD